MQPGVATEQRAASRQRDPPVQCSGLESHIWEVILLNLPVNMGGKKNGGQLPAEKSRPCGLLYLV